MKKSIWKLILYIVLCIVVGTLLTVVAIRTGSDYLHDLAIIGPTGVMGYFISLESKEGKEPRLRWWQLMLAILVVTTAFWLLKNYVF